MTSLCEARAHVQPSQQCYPCRSENRFTCHGAVLMYSSFHLWPWGTCQNTVSAPSSSLPPLWGDVSPVIIVGPTVMCGVSSLSCTNNLFSHTRRVSFHSTQFRLYLPRDGIGSHRSRGSWSTSQRSGKPRLPPMLQTHGLQDYRFLPPAPRG